MFLLCRNKVADYEKWRAVFESHADAHRAVGLNLEDHWVDADDPNQVFFLFSVDDRGKAEGFMAAPQAAEGAEASGVIDGDFWFVREADRY